MIEEHTYRSGNFTLTLEGDRQFTIRIEHENVSFPRKKPLTMYMDRMIKDLQGLKELLEH